MGFFSDFKYIFSYNFFKLNVVFLLKPSNSFISIVLIPVNFKFSWKDSFEILHESYFIYFFQIKCCLPAQIFKFIYLKSYNFNQVQIFREGFLKELKWILQIKCFLHDELRPLSWATISPLNRRGLLRYFGREISSLLSCVVD